MGQSVVPTAEIPDEYDILTARPGGQDQQDVAIDRT
jgi:hypothetical protein